MITEEQWNEEGRKVRKLNDKKEQPSWILQRLADILDPPKKEESDSA